MNGTETLNNVIKNAKIEYYNENFQFYKGKLV